jgi:tetratricopeptide (TPR) repeat protein/TolB-like protein
MSPEQSRGEPVDSRTDIWSLGVMLYEMLTGRRPFVGEHEQAVIRAIVNDEPEPPTGLRTGIPLELERLVKKAMAKSPKDRYQHVDDLLVDLRSVQTELQDGSRTITAVSASGSDRQSSRGRPLVLGLVLCSIVIAGAAIIMTVVRNRRATTGPARRERVMVGAFENRSGEASLDRIGDIAVTSAFEGLVQLGNVEVVAYGTDEELSGRYAGGDVSEVLSAARESGATMLVTGSLHATSDSVYLEARVLGVADKTALSVIPIEAAPLENPYGAISIVRSRIMGAVAAWADPTIGERGRRYAPAYEAYQEYASGIRLFGAYNRQALEHFERAADLDPGFASASIWRMGALHVLQRYAESDSLIENVLRQPGFVGPNERLLVDAIAATYQGNIEEGVRNLREYVRLEPGNWWAKRLLGLTAMRVNRPNEAIQVFEALAEQGPQTDAYAESWTYSALASAYHTLGEHERELEILRQGIGAFPDALWLRSREVRALAALGRSEEIAEIIEESKRTPAGDGSVWGIIITAIDELRAHGHSEHADPLAEEAVVWQRRMMASRSGDERSRRRLASALFRTKRWQETLAIYEELAQAHPDDIDYQGSLGVLAARTGDRDRALEIKNAMLARDVPYEFGMDTYWAACISSQLGEREEAMELVRIAFAEGANIASHAHQDPDLEPLWDYPPFQRFLEPRD